MTDHKPGCPRLQAWDLSEWEVPCLCDTLGDDEPADEPEKLWNPNDSPGGQMTEERTTHSGIPLDKLYKPGEKIGYHCVGYKNFPCDCIDCRSLVWFMGQGLK